MDRISARDGELRSGSRRKRGGSGILRIGTTSYIDSFNPWNYIEGQGLNAMVMVYPLLVQLDYTNKEGYVIVGDWAKSWKASNGGKTWTFKLRPNGQVVGRQGDDGRRRRVDDQHDDQVRGGCDCSPGRIAQPREAGAGARTRRRSS